MAIYARPFEWQRESPWAINALLDAFVAFPEFLAYPMAPEEARAIGASLITDPLNVVYGVYSDNTLTGCVILTRVVVRIDALFHFMFIDRDLASKRKVLKEFCKFALTDLGFRRLSFEVPDLRVDLEDGGKARGTRLERFARKHLGFRLEGETRPFGELSKNRTADWVARQGSRSEQAYFDGTRWHDVIRLRLLATEVECLSEQVQEPSSPPSSEPVSAASSEVAAPVTPSPSSPRTSSPSDSRTSDSSSTS